jgi:hypothetical protein
MRVNCVVVEFELFLEYNFEECWRETRFEVKLLNAEASEIFTLQADFPH